MSQRRRIPDPPANLARETQDLLITLEATVINLRQFTERLRQATADHAEGDENA